MSPFGIPAAASIPHSYRLVAIGRYCSSCRHGRAARARSSICHANRGRVGSALEHRPISVTEGGCQCGTCNRTARGHDEGDLRVVDRADEGEAGGPTVVAAFCAHKRNEMCHVVRLWLHARQRRLVCATPFASVIRSHIRERTTCRALQLQRGWARVLVLNASCERKHQRKRTRRIGCLLTCHGCCGCKGEERTVSL